MDKQNIGERAEVQATVVPAETRCKILSLWTGHWNQPGPLASAMRRNRVKSSQTLQTKTKNVRPLRGPETLSIPDSNPHDLPRSLRISPVNPEDLGNAFKGLPFESLANKTYHQMLNHTPVEEQLPESVGQRAHVPRYMLQPHLTPGSWFVGSANSSTCTLRK